MNTVDKEHREYAINILLTSIGEDTQREGLVDTPRRVAKMYEEVFNGYRQNPKEILSTEFTEASELVMVKDIPFYSHCEHHMVPFFGKAHVAYIPDKKVVGISKIARLVDCFAKRLQIQERLTKQVADTLMEVTAPLGVAVVIEAEHMCMTMRGVQKPGTLTVTAAMRGVFMEASTRMEFYQLLRGGK